MLELLEATLFRNIAAQMGDRVGTVGRGGGEESMRDILSGVWRYEVGREWRI